jgi:tRNA(fMet)-specific endonuclease VapC
LIDAERSKSNVDEVIDDLDNVAIAAITVAELQVGVELATGKTTRCRLKLFEEIVVLIPILEYDVDVGRARAQPLVIVRLRGRPQGAHDLTLAATALLASRSLVTADKGAYVELPGIVTIAHR